MRLVIIQYGPYAEAVHRLAAGGKENYYGQKYSVDFVAELAARMEDLTVLHLAQDDPEERLPSGVRSLGIELYPKGRRARHLSLLRILRRLRPDHLIVGSPLSLVIIWALANGIRMLPLFADSFQTPGIKAKAKFALLRRVLNNRKIEWVSNHNLAASLDLVRIGVDPNKVVPFDWPALMSPAARPPKKLSSTGPFKLIYVGQVTESKGVGDLIEALRILALDPAGPRWRATIVGGENADLKNRVEALGVGALVDYAGRVSHDEIVPMMNQHDVVVVPSRHEYPEGLPMTIYEGLCSRTPLVVSDHPMFKQKIRDGESALVFRAGKPAALAGKLKQLVSDASLYEALSKGADAVAAEFFCPLKYHELISRWLTGSPTDRQVLSSFSVATGRYGLAETLRVQ